MEKHQPWVELRSGGAALPRLVRCRAKQSQSRCRFPGCMVHRLSPWQMRFWPEMCLSPWHRSDLSLSDGSNSAQQLNAEGWTDEQIQQTVDASPSLSLVTMPKPPSSSGGIWPRGIEFGTYIKVTMSQATAKAAKWKERVLQPHPRRRVPLRPHLAFRAGTRSRASPTVLNVDPDVDRRHDQRDGRYDDRDNGKSIPPYPRVRREFMHQRRRGEAVMPRTYPRAREAQRSWFDERRPLEFER